MVRLLSDTLGPQERSTQTLGTCKSQGPSAISSHSVSCFHTFVLKQWDSYGKRCFDAESQFLS